MRYAIIAAFVSLVIGASVTHAQDLGLPTNTKVDSLANTISVADFGTKNVIGYLGHPLGTVVRVTGVAVDGDTTRRKRNMGKTLLEIHTVNGQQLETKLMFDFGRAPKSLAKPKPGTNFDYYIHEYGGFDGVVVPPKELNIDFPMIAHQGFHYRSYMALSLNSIESLACRCV